MIKKSVPAYFKARRDRLMKAHEGAVFVFPANPHTLRNPDVHYEFRQESNFYYLTGFDEPHAYLVLAPKQGGGSGYRTILFVQKRDPIMEIWNGERYGTDGALNVFGADEAYLESDFDRIFPNLLQGCTSVYYRMNTNTEADRVVLRILDRFRSSLGRTGMGLLPVYDPQGPLGEMRLFKTPEEVDILKKACQLTALAHKTAMEQVKPGMNEYEAQAIVEYVCKKNGSQRPGYGSIVAGGKNATCLHYVANNEPLKDGDLLLIDAGTEWDYYTADITRTFPIGRTFSQAQSEIYDLVLKSQKEVISMCKPGVPYQAMHRKAVDVLVEGLMSLGVLKGKKEDIIKSEEFKKYYPHGTGHYLGMDVHDVGLYKVPARTPGQAMEERLLEPGMCFTVEPGLYFQPTDSGYPEKYRNIGIRIEDNILITPQGHDVLTHTAPKERGEIEKLRA